ncbi:kinase-like protein [Massarina eburnea CBS 473.64]|uniref:Kinase-like protein n=1 Tax=Massarina eburnea CBS 473.64 TaxID=1395130 RepID=A0A6A6RRW9_9PLEO|nr:kinase-like protein [Massarina eburnea CBS 473.64]
MPPKSLFRRPSDSSSSDEDTSDHPKSSTSVAEDSLLSRINTLESTSSGMLGGQAGLPATPPAVASSKTDQLRDILIHSLLEEKTLRDAADRLSKDPSDPEVKQVAKASYQTIARQLSDIIDHAYASDTMEHARATAKEGITRVTRAHLNSISREANAVGTAAAAGVSQALVPRIMPIQNDGVKAITANLDLALGLRAPIPTYLHGLHGLHTDRYTRTLRATGGGGNPFMLHPCMRDYTEIGMVGKGGYGKVYKVKHKLDDSFYAVKRITVSPSKMQSLANQGAQAQEMENMLKEVRSLARLDHVNIVRYHNAWLEYSSVASHAIDPDPLLKETSVGTSTSSAHGAAYSEHGQYSDMGIVFEDSDAGPGAQESLDEIDELPSGNNAVKRKERRPSEATVTSLSSIKSRENAAEPHHEGGSEEDIEVIPRAHSPTFEESSSFMSNSDMPNQLVASRHTGACLTLNVQMSLYESNLSALLSSEKPGPTHCYHPCISLELVGSILSGVRYLHSRGVVHRDLKPANIFLSLSSSGEQPFSSVDLSSCQHCTGRDRLYVTPRIGDFGLVAVLGDVATSKPVGTEFYRPPAGGSISEKLDVYALGVVAVELLQYFGTRMERIEALTKMRRGELPEGFGEVIGGDLGRKVEMLLIGMLHDDEEMRWGCEQVKREIEKIVSGCKV